MLTIGHPLGNWLNKNTHEEVCRLLKLEEGENLESLAGGRNNLVRLRPRGSTYTVVKKFSLERNSGFKRELAFYQYLSRIRSELAPRLLGQCERHRVLEIERIEGQPLADSDLNKLELAFDFVFELNGIRPNSFFLPPATEAVFSIETLIEAVTKRYAALENLMRGSQQEIPNVVIDLGKRIAGMLDSNELEEEVRKLFAESDFLSGSSSRKLVSPSDFGPHNWIYSNGRILHLDFEYGGLDSPLKFFGDLISHPNLFHLGEGLEDIATDKIGRLAHGHKLPQRGSVRRVFGIRWSLIMALRVISGNGGIADRDLARYVDWLFVR